MVKTLLLVLALEMYPNIFRQAAKVNILSLAEMLIHPRIRVPHLSLVFIKGYIKKRISTSKERRKRNKTLKRKRSLKPAPSIPTHNPLRESQGRFLRVLWIWSKSRSSNHLAHSTNFSKIRLNT
jgi:hypothetical protein